MASAATVWAFGSDRHGQLGLGEGEAAGAIERGRSSTRRVQPLPQRASALAGGAPPAAVAAGGDHSAALDAAGGLHLWGRGLGGGVASDRPVAAPPPAPGTRDDGGGGCGSSRRWTQVALGWGHALALSDVGDVYAWGSDRYGQLGLADVGGSAGSVEQPTPWPVPGLSGPAARGRCVAVAAGSEHSAALLLPTANAAASGRVLAWGWGEHGQLGLGSPDDAHAPTEVPGLATGQGALLAAGSGFTLLWGGEPTNNAFIL